MGLVSHGVILSKLSHHRFEFIERSFEKEEVIALPALGDFGMWSAYFYALNLLSD